MTNTPMIQVENVSKRFPKTQADAVQPTSFTVAAGEFITILGTSGSGKTTLMKMINRLYEPTTGTIYINGQDTRQMDVNVLRRRIGYVIQQHGLFEHWTVAQNIATVCQILKWDKAKIAQRVDETLRLVQLDPDQYRNRHPHQLSGGEQQRVGIARALAADPDILLMDEPFGAVDAVNRATLQDEIQQIQRQTHKTIIFVTHDIDEALKLGDRTMLFRNGAIQQFATQDELFLQPANDFVADFLKVHDQVTQWRYIHAGSLVQTWQAAAHTPTTDPVAADQPLAVVVEHFLKVPTTPVTVVDAPHQRWGKLTLADLARLAEAPSC